MQIQDAELEPILSKIDMDLETEFTKFKKIDHSEDQGLDKIVNTGLAKQMRANRTLGKVKMEMSRTSDKVCLHRYLGFKE